MPLKTTIDKFGNSRPIFKLEVTGSKTRVESRLVSHYLPNFDNSDALAALVAQCYEENLVGDAFEKNYEAITRDSMSQIKLVASHFITVHGGYKNARQSAVFRFLGTYTLPDEANRGLVYLYVYMKSLNMEDNGWFPAGTDDKHIDNIIAILELMRSKFESRS